MFHVWTKRIVGLSVALVLLLAGCGGSSDTKSNTSTKTPAGSSTSSTTTGSNQASTTPAASQLSGKLMIVGSGSGITAARKAAEKFKAANPKVELDIPDSVGSSASVKQLIDGKADVAMPSRTLKDDEKKNGLNEVVIGSSPLVFIVNPSVTGVTNITKEQVSGIYTGKIKNWKEIGGPDAAIVPILPYADDSDRDLLNSVIPGVKDLKDDAVPWAIVTKETNDMIQKFTNTKGTFAVIKYEALRTGAIQGVPLKLDGVLFSETSAVSGKYPLSKPVDFIYKGEAKGLVKAFMDYLVSAEGQKALSEVGIVPVKATQ